MHSWYCSCGFSERLALCKPAFFANEGEIHSYSGNYWNIRHDERPRLRRGHSSCRISQPCLWLCQAVFTLIISLACSLEPLRACLPGWGRVRRRKPAPLKSESQSKEICLIFLSESKPPIIKVKKCFRRFLTRPFLELNKTKNRINRARWL